MSESGPPPDASNLAELIDLVRPARRLVVLTGAGISTESGIPDYRGPGGVWTTGKIPRASDLASDPDARRAYWAGWLERYPELERIRPNRGHLALVALERAGVLSAIVTQNIDGLHVVAGNDPGRVLELHGTRRLVRCRDCGTRFPAEDILARVRDGESDPPCVVCGGPLRGATVLFGESLPVDTLRRALDEARAADVMLAVGSSLVVNPAARLPSVTRQAGGRTAIVNREATGRDGDFDVVVRGEAGATLVALITALGLDLPADPGA